MLTPKTSLPGASSAACATARAPLAPCWPSPGVALGHAVGRARGRPGGAGGHASVADPAPRLHLSPASALTSCSVRGAASGRAAAAASWAAAAPPVRTRWGSCSRSASLRSSSVLRRSSAGRTDPCFAAGFLHCSGSSSPRDSVLPSDETLMPADWKSASTTCPAVELQLNLERTRPVRTRGMPSLFSLAAAAYWTTVCSANLMRSETVTWICFDLAPAAAPPPPALIPVVPRGIFDLLLLLLRPSRAAVGWVRGRGADESLPTAAARSSGRESFLSQVGTGAPRGPLK